MPNDGQQSPLPTDDLQQHGDDELSIEQSGVYLKFGEGKLDFGDDETLIAGLLGNLPLAWREFQKRFDPLVRSCISKVTRRFASVISRDEASEIHAIFYLSLLANDRRKLRSFDPSRGNRLSSWIGLLTINCAYDFLRPFRREPPKEQLDQASDVANDVPDAFDMTADRQRAAIAATALERFSARDRTFAALYFGEGLTPPEIAERMNISVKTVYSKRNRIQARLEALLNLHAAPSNTNQTAAASSRHRVA